MHRYSCHLPIPGLVSHCDCTRSREKEAVRAGTLLNLDNQFSVCVAPISLVTQQLFGGDVQQEGCSGVQCVGVGVPHKVLILPQAYMAVLVRIYTIYMSVGTTRSPSAPRTSIMQNTLIPIPSDPGDTSTRSSTRLVETMCSKAGSAVTANHSCPGKHIL